MYLHYTVPTYIICLSTIIDINKEKKVARAKSAEDMFFIYTQQHNNTNKVCDNFIMRCCIIISTPHTQFILSRALPYA